MPLIVDIPLLNQTFGNKNHASLKQYLGERTKDSLRQYLVILFLCQFNKNIKCNQLEHIPLNQ